MAIRNLSVILQAGLRFWSSHSWLLRQSPRNAENVIETNFDESFPQIKYSALGLWMLTAVPARCIALPCWRRWLVKGAVPSMAGWWKFCLWLPVVLRIETTKPREMEGLVLKANWAEEKVNMYGRNSFWKELLLQNASERRMWVWAADEGLFCLLPNKQQSEFSS